MGARDTTFNGSVAARGAGGALPPPRLAVQSRFTPYIFTAFSASRRHLPARARICARTRRRRGELFITRAHLRTCTLRALRRAAACARRCTLPATCLFFLTHFHNIPFFLCHRVSSRAALRTIFNAVWLSVE